MRMRGGLASVVLEAAVAGWRGSSWCVYIEATAGLCGSRVVLESLRVEIYVEATAGLDPR